MRTGLLRLAAVVLFIGAVVLAWLAFTRFEPRDPPAYGTPAYQEFERERMGEARLSVGLGLAASFSLFGAFACHTLAGRPLHPPEP